ncbi:MAG: sigma 54-interacting transcriptional regulator [Planctomycetaceae bacterium]|nr:sigma 54-interacting transcriptional regulator [Planctomycetaceae bacterium]
MGNQIEQRLGVAVLRGTDGSTEFALAPGVAYSIGRLAGVAVPINGTGVSNLHAVLAGDGRKWMLTDLSRNGTTVNERPVGRHTLEHGDRIRFSEGPEFEFLLGNSECDLSTVIGMGADDSIKLPVSTSVPYMVGSTKATLALKSHINKAAASRKPVVVRGEMGVGKRLVASTIHEQGETRFGSCVEINCSRTSPAELAKHLQEQRGVKEPGSVVLAHLLELDDASQQTLAELLSSMPSNGSGNSPRIISTTSRSPEAAIDAGEFSSALYYKLGVVQILVDPLRERRQEVAELANYFARLICERLGRAQVTVSSGTVQLLQQYHWPGNVLELRNVVERAVVFCDGSEIERQHLALGFCEALRRRMPYEGMSLDDVEHRHIEGTLETMNWVKLHVAETLGIERSTLDRKIKKYGLVKPGQEGDSSDD